MVGLQQNNQHVLQQWYNLFKLNGNIRSVQAYKHWEHALRLGVPNNTNKKWKYLKLNKFFSYIFIAPEQKKIDQAQCNKLSLSLDAYRVVFINGYFSPILSCNNTGLWKIKIEQNRNRQILPDPIQTDFFLHLTESLNNEVTRITLPTGQESDKPLYLLHISFGNYNKNKLTTLHYRHHIEIFQNTKGQIIEHFVSIDKSRNFNNARISIIVGDNAQLHHMKLVVENSSSYHFAHNDIHAGKNSIINSNIFLISESEFTQHQTSAKLHNRNAYLSINSLTLSSKNNTNHLSTYLEHKMTNCYSRQLHKMIACDHGIGIFHGLIKVLKHAVQTNGKMTNNNLLLGKNAIIHTEPKLEIYANDIKCSHGATVGYLDKNQMFYLRTRGIPYQNALHILIQAFTSEIIHATKHKIINDILTQHISNILKKVTI